MQLVALAMLPQGLSLQPSVSAVVSKKLRPEHTVSDCLLPSKKAMPEVMDVSKV
jgi:hypothetical protein